VPDGDPEGKTCDSLEVVRAFSEMSVNGCSVEMAVAGFCVLVVPNGVGVVSNSTGVVAGPFTGTVRFGPSETLILAFSFFANYFGVFSYRLLGLEVQTQPHLKPLFGLFDRMSILLIT
jgi:hypothetical protein